MANGDKVAERTLRPKLKHALEFALLRLVVALARALGVDRASALFGRLWRWLAPFNARHDRVRRHLALAMPDLGDAERDRLIGNMWENLGRTSAEMLLLPELIAERGRFTYSDEAAAIIEACRGKGIIMCSLHQGNWELVGWWPRLLGLSLAAVYKRLHNPYSETFLRSLRLPIYDAGLLEAGNVSALRLRSLARRGTAISLLADLPDDTGIEAPFFGHPAKLASFPIVLARHLDLPVLVGRCLRTEGAHFVFEAVRLDPPRTEDVAADIVEGTRRLHAQLEAWIADHPEQWMWGIRKWGYNLP